MTATDIPTPTSATTGFEGGGDGADLRPRSLHPLREAGTFVGLAYGLAVVVALLLPGTRSHPGPASVVSGVVPVVTLLLIGLTTRVRHAPANPIPLGVRRAGLRYWPFAVLVPAAAIGASFAATWALGVVRFHQLGLYLADAPISLVFMSVFWLVEELGWRGYLLPRLAQVLSNRSASLVTGLIHGVFHIPLMVLTVAYNSEGSRWLVVPGAVAVISLGGVLFGWLRIRSGSVWPAAIAHAAVNTALVESPTLVTDRPALAAYLTSEAGLFTLVTVGLLALVLLRRADWTDAAPKAA
ncbi:CPBP family intramembrane metalloprotease [Aquihabitans sp. G128]|uniref:CPBP family intramembrane glutamic endopeptidase n=1 Tax=Aquihabitans sp. G128 TaxID=2849779 RepID=UPI001C21FF09|nr:CPBP family intramembrane glutamic endopeptidase [Aquihabitans sp. G128]QXC60831.1 CPBP family intramembrane metalloprotease [Aquihabitans sp. G128]